MRAQLLTLLLGLVMTEVAAAVFVVVAVLATTGRLRFRPVHLLLPLTMIVGVAVMAISMVSVIGNPFATRG